MTLRTVFCFFVCVLASMIFISDSASATTIYVSPGESIGTALASASAGDTVLVYCGTYAEQGLQMTDGIILRSESGDPDCVTIASAGLDPIITCENLLLMTRIEGITFAAVGDSLQADVPRGAGLLITNSSPQISQCHFVNLSADYGGAVYCGGGSAPVFDRCVFRNNLARAVGGAINCVASSPFLASCLFVGNIAESGGAALNTAAGSHPNVVACTLDGNRLTYGGAAFMAWNDGSINVVGTIVVGEVWSGDAGSLPGVSCSDFYIENSNAWPGLLADLANVSGNISVDPLFCGDAGGDYFYTLDVTSPCTAEATAGCSQMGAFPVGCALSGVIDDRNLPNPETRLVTGLSGNYPNPFNPSTTIRYNVETPGMVSIAIYDIAGRLVTRLLDETTPAGSHEIQWYGTDRNDRACAAGVYFVQMNTGLVRDTSRLSLIK